jgi:hypothetical protein
MSRGDLLQLLGAAGLGLAVLAGGGSLTAYEMQVSGIRQALRSNGSELPMPGDANGAGVSIQTDSLDSDVAGRLLGFALYKESSGALANAGRADPQAEQWIEGIAARLAARSPLDAQPWCILAIAETRRNGMSSLAVRQLRACYKYAPFEDWAVTWRLSLALASWNQLPSDLRSSAITEIAYQLSIQELRSVMVQRLAFATATIASERAALARSLVELHGQQIKGRFEETLQAFRKQQDKRSLPQ